MNDFTQLNTLKLVSSLFIWILSIIFILGLGKSITISILFIIVAPLIIYLLIGGLIAFLMELDKTILMGISIGLSVAIVITFINKEWVVGLFLINIWFIVGLVGAIFHPHNKGKI